MSITIDREFLDNYKPNNGQWHVSKTAEGCKINSWNFDQPQSNPQYFYCVVGAFRAATGMSDIDGEFKYHPEFLDKLYDLEKKLIDKKIKPETGKKRLIQLVAKYFPDGVI